MYHGSWLETQRAIAAAADVLPASVLATLPQGVAQYVMSCVDLTVRAGPAASLGARYTCVDPAALKMLLKRVSTSPDIASAYMRALLEAFAPASSVLGAMSLQNSADAGSVPPSYIKEAQTALENSTIEETAQALVRAGAAEADVANGVIWSRYGSGCRLRQ